MLHQLCSVIRTIIEVHGVDSLSLEIYHRQIYNNIQHIQRIQRIKPIKRIKRGE